MSTKRTPLGKSRRAELGVIDYTLAKRVLLRDAQLGVLGMTDICDAHPELMRAARHVGEATNNDCPVCGKEPTVTELIDYDAFCGVPAGGVPPEAEHGVSTH